MSRRLLAVAAIAAAAFVGSAPATSQAFFCVATVNGICLPCGPVNTVYDKVTGGPLLYC